MLKRHIGTYLQGPKIWFHVGCQSGKFWTQNHGESGKFSSVKPDKHAHPCLQLEVTIPVRRPMGPSWSSSLMFVSSYILRVGLRVENSLQIRHMRVENYWILGVGSHPNRQILRHCFVGMPPQRRSVRHRLSGSANAWKTTWYYYGRVDSSTVQQNFIGNNFFYRSKV